MSLSFDNRILIFPPSGGPFCIFDLTVSLYRRSLCRRSGRSPQYSSEKRAKKPGFVIVADPLETIAYLLKCLERLTHFRIFFRFGFDGFLFFRFVLIPHQDAAPFRGSAQHLVVGEIPELLYLLAREPTRRVLHKRVHDFPVAEIHQSEKFVRTEPDARRGSLFHEP